MNKRLRIFLSTVMAVAVSATALLTACGNDSDNDKTDNESGYTVLDRAKELVENIDAMPTSSDLTGIEDDKLSAASLYSVQPYAQKQFEGYTETDVSVPGEEYYQTQKFTISLGNELDSDIEQYKAQKDFVLDKVRQLSVWVYEEVYTSYYYVNKYRIDYDINSDTVTVESLWDTGYSKIQSTYNSAGKIVLKGTTTIVDNGRVEYSSSVYYEEDKICTWAQTIAYSSNEVVLKKVIEKDYVTDKLTFANLQCPYEGDEEERYSYASVQALVEENGIKILYAKSPETYTVNILDDDFYEIASYSIYYLPEAIEKGKAYSLANEQIVLPVYQLSGWDKFSVYSKEVTGGVVYVSKLKTGDREYINFIEDEDGYSLIEPIYEYNSLQWHPALAGSLANAKPFIEISNFSKQDTRIQIDKIGEFLTSLGMSIDGNYLAAIEKSFTYYKDIIAELTAFGYTDYTDFDLDMFNSIYSQSDFWALTYLQFQSLQAEPSISILEQTEENEVFALLDMNVQGNVVLDATTGVLNFSSVTATVPKSILLTQGAEYSLVLALRGNAELIDIAYVSETFAGDQITLQGLGSVNIKNLVSDGDYSLVAYIAKNTDGTMQRLSEFYNLNSAQPAEYLQQWQETKEQGNKLYVYDYTYSINASETGIDVSQYYMVSISNK